MAEERNEAGDSVPSSQDPMTRGVRNLQLTDTPTTQTALSAPAPPPMPNSRRPTQPGATATGIPSLCSMWFVQIQKLSKEPRPHGAHGSEAWWPAAHSRKCCSAANSTVKPVLSVTKSGRGGAVAAATAEGILQPETSLLVIPFRTADNLDTRMQCPLLSCSSCIASRIVFFSFMLGAQSAPWIGNARTRRRRA